MARTVIEEFVATLGWEIDSEELEEFGKQVDDLGNTLKWVAGIAAGASAALGALIVTTNRETAEMANLAQSVGLSAETLEALTGVVKNVGFQADNVVDLVEEMNNKFGEMAGLGEMTAVKESLQILNLEFKELQRLKPEEQFQKIIDAALQLEDQQKAVAAVDMLMGGEANKILGFLRAQGTTLEDILQRYKDINLLTEEGREGAQKFTMIWGQFTTTLQSVIQLFSGLVGEAMAPLVEEFTDFVVLNKDLIKTQVKQWAESVVSAFKFLWSILREVFSVVKGVVDRLGGLKNTLKLLGLAFASIKIATLLASLKSLGVLMAAIKASKFGDALSFLKSPVGILAGLLVILGLAIEDLIVYFQGGNSLLGLWGDKIAEFVDVHIASLIAALFGLSHEEFSMAVLDTFERVLQFITEDIPIAIENLVGRFDELFSVLGDDSASAADKVLAVFTFLQENLFALGETALQFWGGIFGAIGAIITNLGSRIGNFFLDLIDNVFPGFKEGFLDFANSLINIITTAATAWKDIITTAINSIVGFFSKAISKVTGFLKQLPIIGEQFGATPEFEGILPQVAAAPAGLPGLVGGALAGQVTNQSQQSKTDVVNNINVTQQPGEDGEGLARRVVDLMNREVATAVRNNETGIVY